MLVVFSYSNVVMQVGKQINKSKFFSRASLRQRAWAGGIFLAVVALYALFWLDVHQKIDMDRWLDPCGFKQDYDLPCPTCGVTTSVRTFVKGRIFEAFYIQPAGALLCTVVAVSAFFAFLIAVFGVYFRILDRFFAEVKIKYVILAVLIIIAGAWAVTLARALAANK